MTLELTQADQYRRLVQVMEIMEKAATGLSRSKERLFNQQSIDANWVRSIEDQPEREDMMESFVSKFNRFQDMMGDKLLPFLLAWKGEHRGAFVDNLNRAERLGLLASASQWLEARALRNRLVHEYMVEAEEFAQSLILADELSQVLLQTWQNIQSYVEDSHAPE